MASLVTRPSASNGTPIAPRRRLTPAQFAFVRAVLLGLDLRAATDRYLEPGLDIRRAQTELRRLRDELLATARRAHAYGDARVLQLDVAQLPTTVRHVQSRTAPTLEEFRDQVDPDGFYSESELTALYASQYPPTAVDRRTSRIGRLRERQRRALDALESVLVLPPTVRDPPSAWFDPRVARRLEGAGLATIGQLVDWINMKGYGWWQPIPKIGKVAAGHMAAWLTANSDPLGVRLSARAETPNRALVAVLRERARPMADIAPLERLAVPSEFNGQQGTNRVPGARHLDVDNDHQAIEAWLRARAGDNPHTLRTYRREAERLLLWAIFERGRAMSSLTVDDAIAFRQFLADPKPAERWINPRKTTRWLPEWRPFTGALSARSVQFALTVVGSLFDWLVRQHYLAHNIFSALPRAETREAAADADLDRLPTSAKRYLDQAQWGLVRSLLRELGDDERACRARFVVLFAYTTGLRISELVDSRIGRLQAELGTGAGGERRVTLQVLGKGGKIRGVPIVPAVEDALNAYLAARGLPDWIECQRRGMHGVRLIGHLGGRRPADVSVAPFTLHQEIKAVFARAAELARKRGAFNDAEIFERASTHWLRHTFGRHAMNSEVPVPPNIVQAVLGHASLQTTTLYSSEEGEAAFRHVERFTSKRI